MKIIKRILCKICFKLCFQNLIFPGLGGRNPKNSILSHLILQSQLSSPDTPSNLVTKEKKKSELQM